MTDDIVHRALIAARDYLQRMACPDVTYGYFHGGDPRDFCPDAEVCTPEELAAHKTACEAWERGGRPECEAHRHDITQVGTTTVMTSYAGAFGMGTYQMRDEDAEDVLEQIDQALGVLLPSGESKP